MSINILDILKFVLSSLGVGSIIAKTMTYKITKHVKAKEKECEEEKQRNLEQKRMNELNTIAHRVELRPIIKDMCKEIKLKQYMWDNDLQELDEAFMIYDAFNGNGPTKKLYDETRKLPIVSSHEELEKLLCKQMK